jgi:hypothetical protein
MGTTIILKISRGLGLGKGEGSLQNYASRAISAILKLRSEYVRWPTYEKRTIIAERIRKKFHIPNCAGILDETMFPLQTRPLINGEGEVYFTRNRFYGINGLIRCDNFVRIMDIYWSESEIKTFTL